MPIYEFGETRIEPLTETTFSLAGIHERRDLQRLLRDHVEVIAPETLVISEEFGDWDESRRRIDLLAIDKKANLVVIELKRTEDGGHMELQGIRYASMVSTMTFDQAVDVFGRHLKQTGKDDQNARDILLEFLDWEDPDENKFAQDVRIVLASAEFSRELTSAVLWLASYDIDIRCVRLKPYRLAGRLLVDVQQIVPLPETSEYQVQVREKVQKERQARVSNADFTRFNLQIDDEVHQSIWKRNAIFLISKWLCEHAVGNPEEIATLFTWRKTWYSVEGTVDRSTFEKLAAEKAASGGPAFDQPRWFCDDDELIHANGKTYAFSKMWGGKGWYRAMNLLKEKYNQVKIEFSAVA